MALVAVGRFLNSSCKNDNRELSVYDNCLRLRERVKGKLNLPTATNAIFHGPNVDIVAEDIIAFSTIVGNNSDAYRSFGSKSEVPMDFGIKLGWKAIMKPLFPKSIPGDLLALVHLSNRFDMRDKAPKLKVSKSALFAYDCWPRFLLLLSSHVASSIYRSVTQSPARPKSLALLTARLEKPCQSREPSFCSKVA